MKSGLLARGLAALALLPAAARADVAEAPILVTAARTAPLEGLGGLTLTPTDLTRRADPSALDVLDRLRTTGRGETCGARQLTLSGTASKWTTWGVPPRPPLRNASLASVWCVRVTR